VANIIVIGASAGGLHPFADHSGDHFTAESFREVAQDRQREASIIRAMLLSKNKSDEIIAPQEG
jgi:hypothetical protein